MIKTIMFVEIFILGFSYLGSWFIGIANREDIELKITRKILFIAIFIGLNAIIFSNN